MSDEATVTDLYGKDENGRIDIEFIDLTHTGSGDDRENQVAVLTVPEDLLYPIRDTYRSESPHGISDFEYVRNDDGTVSIYCGGSYGASTLFGAVGKLIYKGQIFHEF